MASKSGRVYYQHTKTMERLAKQLDRRTKEGKDHENVNHAFQNHHHLSPEGARVWSF